MCPYPAQYSAAYRRCLGCDLGLAWHVALYLGYWLVMMALTTLLTYKSIQGIGTNAVLGASLLRVLITYYQTIALVVVILRGQDPDVASAGDIQYTAYFDFPSQAVWHFGCMVHWTAAGRTLFWILLPLYSSASLLALLGCAMYLWGLRDRTGRAGAALAHAAGSWFRIRRRPAPDGPAGAPLPLDSRGNRFCDQCTRTYAMWHCLECPAGAGGAGAHLCEPCDRHRHPRSNPLLHAHHRVPVEPACHREGVNYLALVFNVGLYEAYRLTGPSVVRGIFMWFKCSEEICSAPGACDTFLLSDTAVSCRSAGWRAMFVVALVAVVGIMAGVPAWVVAAWTRNRRRLHQERVILRWGWLFQGYHWYAGYWDAVVLVRKFAVVVIAEVGLSVTAGLNSMIIVCVVALFLENLVGPYAHLAAHRFEAGTLTALIITALVVCVAISARGAGDAPPDLGVYIPLVLATNAAWLVGLLASLWHSDRAFVLATLAPVRRAGQRAWFVCCVRWRNEPVVRPAGDRSAPAPHTSSLLSLRRCTVFEYDDCGLACGPRGAGCDDAGSSCAPLSAASTDRTDGGDWLVVVPLTPGTPHSPRHLVAPPAAPRQARNIDANGDGFCKVPPDPRPSGAEN